MTISSHVTVIDWREGETTKCPVCGGWSARTVSLYTDYCPKCDKTIRYYEYTWRIINGNVTTKEELDTTHLKLMSCCDRCSHLDGKNDCVTQHTHIRHPYKTTCNGFHRYEVME